MASDAKACFSSKVEHHSVVWYLYLKGKTGKEIHSELAHVYGSSAPSYQHMATKASVYSTLLKQFRSKDDFLLHLVTVDETWAHYYEPENKAQSRQWVGPGSPRPKKFKTQPSAGKVMATVFWDAKGIIMLDSLPLTSTISGVYYANLLDQLRTAIREKCQGKLSKVVLLQLDNASVHFCKVAMDAVE